MQESTAVFSANIETIQNRPFWLVKINWTNFAALDQLHEGLI